MDDTHTETARRAPAVRHQIRRRALPACYRGEFDRLLLDGEDINKLARRFGIEPWYAKRRATRVLARSAEENNHSSMLAPAPAIPKDLTPTQYACALLGGRVRSLPNGYYVLDNFHAGPREVIRAANRILRERGMKEIYYPGLMPFGQ